MRNRESRLKMIHGFLRSWQRLWRFRNGSCPEPIYAKTGKGYLKSTGVSEIQAAKEKQAGISKLAARSLAGHLVAGVAGDEEVQDFKKFCEKLG